MSKRQLQAGILLCILLSLAVLPVSCLVIRELEAQEPEPEVQVTTVPAGGMSAGEWIGLAGAILGGLGTLATVVFTQLRAMRREAQEHQEKMAAKTEAVAREAAERADIAQAQRERTNKSLAALRTEVKAATGVFSAEDNRRIAEAAGIDVTPEGDPE